MRRQKKPTFAINIRFSHFAPLISLPRTLFAHSHTLYKPSVDADPCPRTLFPRLQTLYTRYSGLNGSTMHCCK